jgi:hypothetical protein
MLYVDLHVFASHLFFQNPYVAQQAIPRITIQLDGVIQSVPIPTLLTVTIPAQLHKVDEIEDA